jgi:hypothetical protein
VLKTDQMADKKQQKKQSERKRNHTGTTGKRPGEGPREIGGPDGPDPTRYGDWEKAGRCVDF